MSYVSNAEVEKELLDELTLGQYSKMEKKVIDLTKVPFIDADGIQVLKTCYNRNIEG